MMMKKYWSIFFLNLVMVTACIPARKQQNEVVLKESLSAIVDSFTRSNPDKEIYELYMDKKDPHNGILTLYAGDRSLIEPENLYNNQKSIIYTLSNDKEINIYSGLERYVKNVKSEIDSVKTQSNLDKVFWIITDSFNVFKVYKNFESVYPFMPIIFDTLQFIPPMPTVNNTSLPVNAKNNTDSVKVGVLQIVNNDLVVVLDSIVDHEKQCEYYSSNLLFSIWIHDKKFTIGSIGERIKNSKNILGCFVYKNHLFFVEGKYLNDTLLKRTKQKMKYCFAVSKTGTDPKTGIMFIDSMDLQDDSYSYWVFIYENSHLVFQEKQTYCE
jgi:hypothetical protein